jgi:hypothetical protein
LALAPDPSDTFAREVDENLRRDQMRDFAKKYGTLLVVAIALFLAAVGGWLYWQNRQQQQTAEQSEELMRVFTDIGAGRNETVPQRLEPLESAKNDLVRATALLTGAAVALEKNDRDAARAKYRAIADDGSMPETYRQLALVRVTALEFDSMRPEDVVTRLQPLAQAGNPWFGSAGEMTAMAYLKQGRKEEAGRLFAAIAADQQVPESIRSRAVQIAGTLGIDATASLPAQTQ